MWKSRVVVSLAVAGLLVTASATQVVARDPVGTAKGWITWTGQTDQRPGRTSVFRVRDGGHETLRP